MLYPLGSFIVIKNLKSGKESFFDGHTREVSCMSLSKNGLRMATGQQNVSGVKVEKWQRDCITDVIVIDRQRGYFASPSLTR